MQMELSAVQQFGRGRQSVTARCLVLSYISMHGLAMVDGDGIKRMHALSEGWFGGRRRA